MNRYKLVPWRGEKKFTRLMDRSSRLFIRSSSDLEVLQRMGITTFCEVLVAIGALMAEIASINHHVRGFKKGNSACASFWFR